MATCAAVPEMLVQALVELSTHASDMHKLLLQQILFGFSFSFFYLRDRKLGEM